VARRIGRNQRFDGAENQGPRSGKKSHFRATDDQSEARIQENIKNFEAGPASKERGRKKYTEGLFYKQGKRKQRKLTFSTPQTTEQKKKG